MLERGRGQGHHKQNIEKKKKRMVLSRSLNMGFWRLRSSQGLKLIH